MTEVQDGTAPARTTAPPHLLQGFAEQTPGPLLPALVVFGGQVSEEELVDFVRQAPINNNAMVALRLAFAKWDASDDIVLLDPDGIETGSGTIARRLAV